MFVSDVNQDRLLMVPRFGGIPLNTGESRALNIAEAYSLIIGERHSSSVSHKQNISTSTLVADRVNTTTVRVQ